jgi:SAM-dependent methyltransferase
MNDITPQQHRRSAAMRLADPEGGTRLAEDVLLRELVAFDGVTVVELGCGKAEQTLRLARAFPSATLLAFEVDAIQHALNIASVPPSNVEFHYGGAEDIALDDAAVDVVLMFKSLHHVPLAKLDHALAEIRRILKPGGLAYISEPVFAGALNEINRIFHDEERVRLAAFAALQRAVEAGVLELVAERFIRIERAFSDFADFERKVLNVTYNDNRLTPDQYDEVRTRFAAHMTASGARFDVPLRIDLLRRPVSH